MKKELILIFILLLISKISMALEMPSATVPIFQYQREYQILERAKEIGLIKNSDLSFKPLTREQFARAIIEIYNNRAISPSLAKKFFDELYPVFKSSVNSVLKEENENYIKPVNNIYFSTFSLSGINNYKLPYSEGYSLKNGLNSRLDISSELKLSRFLIYLEPEYRLEDILRLNRGYITWKLDGLNFLFGKDNIWWGNAENGDLLFTNNVRPWLMFKVENDSYKKLPWIFKYLGEWKFSNIIAQLEKERVRSYAHIWGMRLAWKPFRNLEIAGTRAIQFGGKGRPNYHSLHDFWELFTANNENVRDTNPEAHKYDNNQLASIDITYYLNWLNKFNFQPFKGGKFYFVYGGDDALKPVGPGGLPLPTGAAHILGLSLTTGLTDLKFEYTETTDGNNGAMWYSHHMYPNGYTYHGFIIGNNIGGDSESYFFKVSKDFKFANVSFSYNYVEHGVDRKSIQEKEHIYSLKANKLLNLKNFSFLKVFSTRLYTSFIYDNIEHYDYTSNNKNVYLFSIGLNLQF